MATHGLHENGEVWPFANPSEPIEKIFGTIDYVIDLNEKFGFGPTHTQHIRVRPFFSFFLTFYALWSKTAEPILAQYVIRRRLVRVRPFSRN